MDVGVLVKVFGITPTAAQKWVDPLVKTMDQFHIDTKLRQAAFLAQTGHESGRFLWVAELWGPTIAQSKYERDFTAAWPPTPMDARNRKAYELGNDAQGDGKKFRGHGLIQVTGKANHLACGKALGLNLLNTPELLMQPIYAAMSAGWFWSSHNLNALADAGQIVAMTRVINGGVLGLSERQTFYNALLPLL